PAADSAPATPAPAAEPTPVPAASEKPATSEASAAPNIGAGINDYGVVEESVPVGARMEWAERRSLKVIQKRDVLKQGRHAFTLLGGVVPNDDFFAYINAGLAYNYYFSEDINLEVRGGYTFAQKTSLENSLTAARPTGPGLNVRLPQTMIGHLSVAGMWNLMHGKIGFFETGLIEFDLGLSFGIGAIMTDVQGKSEAGAKFDGQGNIGLTWQFYMSQRWAIRLDYRQFFYPKEGSGLSFPIAASIGLTYFTAPLD
ncbi:MAG: hypothetical protein CMH53_04950, partial [Myxococcales bacterium]|nr:hypothetical protein [Myxococcales bacterium]